jgi:hypothetical protein
MASVAGCGIGKWITTPQQKPTKAQLPSAHTWQTGEPRMPSFTLNPLTYNHVAISLIENGIKPTPWQFNKHSVGDTCWCGPILYGIGNRQMVFNHIGGGENSKVHNYPRYLTTAVGDV